MNYRTPNALALSLLLLLPVGCVDGFRAIGTYRLQDDSPKTTRADTAPDSAADAGVSAPPLSTDPMEQEEQRHEDHDALHDLIAEKMASQLDPADTAPPEERDTVESLASPLGIPRADAAMRLTGKQCLKALKAHEVPFARPDFGTPHIDTPVLLTGPVGGVHIGPKYRGNKRPTNAVMDCRLALALVEVARQAAALGITAIRFYSTYRPLKTPPQKCPKGKGRKKCLKRKRNYQRTLRAKKSQHRFGRAIDIRWFELADHHTLDVLEHFDRRSKTPPCSYTSKTEEARLLSAFVCGIYQYRIFNVMLTPNANSAHHNHFHFDLTPDARWYIIR